MLGLEVDAPPQQNEGEQLSKQIQTFGLLCAY